jgi:hypothetical protein
MYELIYKIIEKAGKEDVSINVAYDMLVAENGADEKLKKASEFLLKNEEAIQKLRKAGRENEIKVLCNMAVAEHHNEIRKYIIALYEEGIIER